MKLLKILYKYIYYIMVSAVEYLCGCQDCFLRLFRRKCSSDDHHYPSRITSPAGCGGAHSNRSCDSEAKEKQKLPVPPSEIENKEENCKYGSTALIKTHSA